MRRKKNTAAGTPRPMPTLAPVESPDCAVVEAEAEEPLETIEADEKIEPETPNSAPG